MSVIVNPLTPADRQWVARFMAEHWSGEAVIAHGVVYHPAELPGFLAVENGVRVGLLTYHIDGGACEVVTIDSLKPSEGVGSALIQAVRELASREGCARLWLITTNDNLAALRFYQKRGFVLVAVHPNALEVSRKLKPQIPLLGNDGIPIRDEIELEIRLK